MSAHDTLAALRFRANTRNRKLSGHLIRLLGISGTKLGSSVGWELRRADSCMTHHWCPLMHHSIGVAITIIEPIAHDQNMHLSLSLALMPCGLDDARMAAPCVQYYPTELDASRFWAAHDSKAIGEPQVPDGFPTKIQSPLAWTRVDAERKESDWIVNISAGEVQAIHGALKAFESTRLSLSEISADTFPLPSNLIRKLRAVSDQCYKGLGFQTVRGIDPSGYSENQNAILYAGIAAHVAPVRGFQDIDWEVVLGHVINLRSRNGNQSTKPLAPAFTNSPVSFHTDNCELLSLYCLEPAQRGGQTLLASAWQVYNELAASRPEVLETLADTWVLDTFKDYARAPPRTVSFLDRAGADKVLLRFSRYPITGWQAQRNPALPNPTQAQLEAIDAVQFIAAANSIALPMHKGDMVFFNDMALMHAREPFENTEGHGRHLLKMYLHDPSQDWPIALSAMAEWKKTYGPNRANGAREEKWWLNHEPIPNSLPDPDPQPQPPPYPIQPRTNG